MSSVDNYKNQYNKLTQTLMEEFLKEQNTSCEDIAELYY